MSDLQLEPLSDDGVALRMLTSDDLALTLAWRNDRRSRPWFHSDALIEPDAHRAWFDAYLLRPDDHVFIAEAGDLAVAQVSLYHVAHGAAEFGRLLVDPERRGEGLGDRASRLCLRVADERLGLQSVHLEVKETNAAAITIYEALGFAVAPSDHTPPGSLYMVRAASPSDSAGF